MFKFPTLRGLIFTPEKLEFIKNKFLPYTKFEFGKIIYFAQGEHITHESKSGGIFSMGEKKIHPAISFEVQIYIYDEVKKRKRPMYLLVWLGGYTKGAIFHCGWQYPRNINFNQEELGRAAKAVYKGVVEEMFEPKTNDKDILKFIN